MKLVKGYKVHKIGKPDQVGKIVSVGTDGTYKVNWGSGTPLTEYGVDLIFKSYK